MDGCPKCGSDRWRIIWRSLFVRSAMVVECERCGFCWRRKRSWLTNKVYGE